MAFRDYLLSSTISDTLEVWELKGNYFMFYVGDYLCTLSFLNIYQVLTGAFWLYVDLGHQTAQRIVHALDPLQSMQEINQNFPSIVSSLSRMKVDGICQLMFGLFFRIKYTFEGLSCITYYFYADQWFY